MVLIEDATSTVVINNLTMSSYLQPRDTFVTKLMKKLKVTATFEKDKNDKEEEEEDVEESWEDLATDEVRRLSQLYLVNIHALDSLCPVHIR